jgi:hypothetical protein
MTPTGTNLLGLVKHLAGVEYEYLGASFKRPAPETMSWIEDGSIWESGGGNKSLVSRPRRTRSRPAPEQASQTREPLLRPGC